MRSLLVAVALLGLSSLSVGAQPVDPLPLVATGECQRFDGVWAFPLDYQRPDELCRQRNGLWVQYLVSEDLVPNVIRSAREPVFLPYGVRQ